MYVVCAVYVYTYVCILYIPKDIRLDFLEIVL